MMSGNQPGSQHQHCIIASALYEVLSTAKWFSPQALREVLSAVRGGIFNMSCCGSRFVQHIDTLKALQFHSLFS